MTRHYDDIRAMTQAYITAAEEEVARLVAVLAALDGAEPQPEEGTLRSAAAPARTPATQRRQAKAPRMHLEASANIKPVKEWMVDVLRDEEGPLTREEIVDRVCALDGRPRKNILIGVAHALRGNAFCPVGDPEGDTWNIAEEGEE